MEIPFAHLRDRSTTGGYIDFAVFNADANSRTNQGRARLLQQLMMAAKQQNLKVDKAALVFSQNGRIMFYGSSDLTSYLANRGVPRFNYTLTI